MDVLRFLPFEGLGKAIRKKRRHILYSAHRGQPSKKQPLLHGAVKKGPNVSESVDLDDYALFLKAMEGVTPLHHDNEDVDCHETQKQRMGQGHKADPRPREYLALMELKALVAGSGIISLKDTSEFVSGGKSIFSPLVSEALHNGRYSVQAYLDLHGMDVVSAISACENFMKEAIGQGLRCVAFIHGRGLGSKQGPVLKRALVHWLERGPFRRRLVAYSSAPPWDGGTGVTYCLLKRSPYKRREKKRNNIP